MQLSKRLKTRSHDIDLTVDFIPFNCENIEMWILSLLNVDFIIYMGSSYKPAKFGVRETSGIFLTLIP